MEVDGENPMEATAVLMDKVKAIEKEISELGGILESNHVDMTGPLVDADGFPRQDIDVYQVRHARHRIICLQNDHKTLMKQIESSLHEIHSQARNYGVDYIATSSYKKTQYESPVAKVDTVSAGSPAENAGLQVGDLILEFGSVNESNFSALQDIAAVVQHSINQKIQVVIKRAEQRMRLQLTPQPWVGKGVLGCNILPIENVDR